MKKFFSIMTSALFVIFLIAATGFIALAGGEKEAEGPLTLHVWYGMGGPDAEYVGKVIDLFNQSQDKIVAEGMTPGNWAVLWTKLDAAYAAGNPPAAIGFHIQEIAPYANKGMLEPIGDRLEKLGLDKSDFVPGTLEGGMYDGKLYGVPIDVHPIAMYYNVDMFKEAGLDPNKPPTTLNELIEYVKKLTKPDGSQWGLGLEQKNDIQFYTFMSIYDQFEGKLVTDDYKSAFNSDAARKAMQFYLDMIYKYKVTPPDEEDARGDFRKKQVAIVFSGPWDNAIAGGFPSVEGLNYKTAKLPKIGTVQATWQSSHMFAAIKQKDPKIVDAAAEFIKFFSDHNVEWAKSGMIVVRKSAQADPVFADSPYKIGFVDSLSTAQFMPLLPKCWEELFEGAPDRPVMRALQSVCKKMTDIDSALARAEEEMNAILDRCY